MNCPYCGQEETKVLESRFIRDATRRRRECQSCQKRFTTYERIENVALFVLKKNGQKVQFDRNKIREGLLKACWKRPITPEQIEEMITEIEQALRNEDDTTISSKKIGELVMKQLKRVDKIAYIRFASVYKEFEDIASFAKEIATLKR